MEDELIEQVEQVAPQEEVAQAPVVEQKLLPQDKVNDIVKRVRMEEREKLQREYGVDLQKLKAAKQAQQTQEEAPALDEDVMSRKIEERLARMAQEHQMKVEQEAEKNRLQNIADTYFKKMETGPELFEDFEDVMKDFNASKNADVIEIAHEFDNLPEIVYELAKNRTKAAELRRLARDDKEDALYELQRLSKSIAQNQQAQQEYSPVKAPLTKHKPSRMGADNGPLTLKELKNASWLKG